MSLFVDVSYWEGQIDWRRAYEAGVREAYIRFATGGKRNAGDYEFIRNCYGASMLMEPDFRWSVYHVPAVADKDDVRFQAGLFTDVLNILRQWTDLRYEFDMPPCGDWEAFQSLLASKNQAFAVAYYEEVSSALGLAPGVYTRASWWNRWMGTKPMGFEKHSFLWLAQPGSGGVATSIPPTVPLAWKAAGKSWDLHQFSWKGIVPGIPGECDLNRRAP